MNFERLHTQKQTKALERIANGLDALVAELRAWRSMSAERSAELEERLAPTIAELARLEDPPESVS